MIPKKLIQKIWNLPEIKTELEDEEISNVENELLEDPLEDTKVDENIVNEDVTIKQNLKIIPMASVSIVKTKIPKVIFPSDIFKSKVKVYDVEKVCGLKPIKFEIVEQCKIQNVEISRTELEDDAIVVKSDTATQSEPTCFRAVGRSENPGVPVLFGGHNLPPLVGIGLTDLPKSGGAMALPAPPGTTSLSYGCRGSVSGI